MIQNQFKINKWSYEDKEKLLQSIQHNTDQKSRRIKWDNVANSFPDRTKNQLQTMYRIVLNSEDQQKNQKWGNIQIYQLLAYVHQYGKKWVFISKQCYDGKISGNALQVQYNRCSIILEKFQHISDVVLSGKYQMNVQIGIAYYKTLILLYWLDQNIAMQQKLINPDYQLPEPSPNLIKLLGSTQLRTARQLDLIELRFYQHMAETYKSRLFAVKIEQDLQNPELKKQFDDIMGKIDYTSSENFKIFV